MADRLPLGVGALTGPDARAPGGPAAGTTDRSHLDAREGDAAAIWVATEKLTPWVKNPRKNDATVDKLAAGIKEHGFGAPILARRDNGEIIAGHTRLKAALRLGLRVVPVRYLDLDEIRAHSLALADNRIGEDSEWDREALARILVELKDAEADLDATGFDEKEVEDLIAKLEAERLGDVDEDLDDDLLALPAEPVSVEGEAYRLGPHRLVCGDSTRLDHVDLAMGEAVGDMMFTDPPYGVNMSEKNAALSAWDGRKDKSGQKIESDDLSVAGLTTFLRDVFALALGHTRAGGAWYVCGPDGPPSAAFVTALGEIGVFRRTITWVKETFVIGRSDYHCRSEFVFYGWNPSGSHYWCGDRTQDNVWEIPRPRASKAHPTMKPVELVQRAIRNSSRIGEHVLDLFGGSGTTMIAAAKERRVAHLVEKDPKYCDVIRRRWARFALKAGLDVGDGIVGEQKSAAEPTPPRRVQAPVLPAPLEVGGPLDRLKN